jgi:hypothetical protein
LYFGLDLFGRKKKWGPFRKTSFKSLNLVQQKLNELRRRTSQAIGSTPELNYS